MEKRPYEPPRLTLLGGVCKYCPVAVFLRAAARPGSPLVTVTPSV